MDDPRTKRRDSQPENPTNFSAVKAGQGWFDLNLKQPHSSLYNISDVDVEVDANFNLNQIQTKLSCLCGSVATKKTQLFFHASRLMIPGGKVRDLGHVRVCLVDHATRKREERRGQRERRAETGKERAERGGEYHAGAFRSSCSLFPSFNSTSVQSDFRRRCNARVRSPAKFLKRERRSRHPRTRRQPRSPRSTPKTFHL